jgi:hypothetical protein
MFVLTKKKTTVMKSLVILIALVLNVAFANANNDNNGANTLGNITVKTTATAISFTWSVANETNTSHYEVVKSDNADFTNARNLGMVFTNEGIANVNMPYMFKDSFNGKPAPTTAVYYKLILKSKTGDVLFTKVIVAQP